MVAYLPFLWTEAGFVGTIRDDGLSIIFGSRGAEE